jgi:siroheme synthase
MGLSTRAATAALLLSRGWDARTPAAVLLSAATTHARSWRGTLANLGKCELPELYPESPGLLVIGATVAVAEQPEAFAAPPLRVAGSRHGWSPASSKALL